MGIFTMSEELYTVCPEKKNPNEIPTADVVSDEVPTVDVVFDEVPTADVVENVLTADVVEDVPTTNVAEDIQTTKAVKKIKLYEIPGQPVTEGVAKEVYHGAVNYRDKSPGHKARVNVIVVTEKIEALPTSPEGMTPRDFVLELGKTELLCGNKNGRCCCQPLFGRVCYRQKYYENAVLLIELRPLSTDHKEEFIDLFDKMGLIVVWC